MKTFLRLLATGMVSVLLLMVSGCTEETETLKGEEEPSPAGLGKFEDWTTLKGIGNDWDDITLRLTKEDVDGKPVLDENGNSIAVLELGWGASDDLLMCEFFGALPRDFNYGVYDGIIFKVLIDHNHDFMVAVRNLPIHPTGGSTSNAGTAFKLSETEYYYNSLWQTIPIEFANAVDSGWGPSPEYGSDLREWLELNKSVQKILTINPELNQGMSQRPIPPAEDFPRGSAAINTKYFTLFSHIGMYKGDDPYEIDEEKDVVWIWDFTKMLDEEKEEACEGDCELAADDCEAEECECGCLEAAGAACEGGCDMAVEDCEGEECECGCLEAGDGE